MGVCGGAWFAHGIGLIDMEIGGHYDYTKCAPLPCGISGRLMMQPTNTAAFRETFPEGWNPDGIPHRLTRTSSAKQNAVEVDYQNGPMMGSSATNSISAAHKRTPRPSVFYGAKPPYQDSGLGPVRVDSKGSASSTEPLAIIQNDLHADHLADLRINIGDAVLANVMNKADLPRAQVMPGTWGICRANAGAGRVVVFSGHPESGARKKDFTRDGIGPERLLLQAALWTSCYYDQQGQNR